MCLLFFSANTVQLCTWSSRSIDIYFNEYSVYNQTFVYDTTKVLSRRHEDCVTTFENMNVCGKAHFRFCVDVLHYGNHDCSVEWNIDDNDECYSELSSNSWFRTTNVSTSCFLFILFKQNAVVFF